MMNSLRKLFFYENIFNDFIAYFSDDLCLVVINFRANTDTLNNALILYILLFS